MTLESERFWKKVRVTPLLNGCWEWTAYRAPNGYGQFDKKCAHRVAYELSVGPIPDGKQLDHLCRSRACVRPDHLEPVTMYENFSRGVAGPGKERPWRKSHCRAGHEYTPENTHMNGVDRQCKTCHNIRQRIRYARLRAEGVASGQ